MYTNVNLAAPLGVMALLGTGFLMGTAGLIFVYTILTRKILGTIAVLLSASVILVLYLVAMLALSFSSSEQALTRGQEKHFCEIDCHLAYSIVAVTDAKTLGDSAAQITAAGTFRSVTIKTRFDENTISPGRGNGLLYPNSRVVTLVDEQGRRY